MQASLIATRGVRTLNIILLTLRQGVSAVKMRTLESDAKVTIGEVTKVIKNPPNPEYVPHNYRK